MSKFTSTTSRTTASGHKRSGKGALASFFKQIAAHHSIDKLTFLCIGTDRSTGDALGPLTGSYLVEYGFQHVMGTLPNPCDAATLKQMIRTIPADHVVIAIDACLGSAVDIGDYLCRERSLVPAESVKGDLPAVGHYSIAGIVNVNGPKPYTLLQMTSLHRVMNMARELAEAAHEGFQLQTGSAESELLNVCNTGFHDPC
ncbi:spore protease YyaC [Paenibacillus urinalis]|uniref:spore protease YyaC n=1 Tax=Paenibacillus urinalis TaxID=521520 RepID=UPI001960EACD